MGKIEDESDDEVVCTPARVRGVDNEENDCKNEHENENRYNNQQGSTKRTMHNNRTTEVKHG